MGIKPPQFLAAAGIECAEEAVGGAAIEHQVATIGEDTTPVV